MAAAVNAKNMACSTHEVASGRLHGAVLCMARQQDFQGGHMLKHPSSMLRNASVAMQAAGTSSEGAARLYGCLV